MNSSGFISSIIDGDILLNDRCCRPGMCWKTADLCTSSFNTSFSSCSVDALVWCDLSGAMFSFSSSVLITFLQLVDASTYPNHNFLITVCPQTNKKALKQLVELLHMKVHRNISAHFPMHNPRPHLTCHYFPVTCCSYSTQIPKAFQCIFVVLGSEKVWHQKLVACFYTIAIPFMNCVSVLEK